MSKAFLTIIRWTTDNPGGSPEHYGVVHYGTDPKNLRETAKSPIRLNPYHASTIFPHTAGQPQAADNLLLHGRFD